jgi:DNA-binding beta-propeller fold protein YncE
VPDLVPRDVVVSPDGAFVYVLMARYEQGAVAVYSRDPGTGALAFANCISEGEDTSGCLPARGLAGARSIAISPDGRSVYVAAHYFDDGGTLTSYARDASTGALVQLEGAEGCMASAPYSDCGQGPHYLDPSSVAVSHDGSTVYVAYSGGFQGGGGAGGILATFGRDPGSGSVSTATCVASKVRGCGQVRGVSGFDQVTIAVDGRTLYLGGRSILGIFEV